MGVDTRITSSASQVLVLTVRNVEMRLRVTVFLGQPKINHIYLIPTLANAHQEVVRLDITMDKGLGVDVFDTGYQLIGQQEDSLQCKFAVAKVEQIFQTRSKKVENHGIVVTLCSKPTNEWNSDTTSEGFVDTCFILQLRMLCLDALQLDRNLFARDDVRTCVLESVRFDD